MPADVAAQAIELIRNHGLDVWVYRGNDWLVGNPKGPHVEHEAWTVKFEPKVVKDVAAELDLVSKVVEVGDDLAAAQCCEADARKAFGGRATANRSQPDYLDVTSKTLQGRGGGLPVAPPRGSDGEIATIGDQPTDVPMFKRSGFSIAMGNAPAEVKALRPSPPIPTTTKALPRRWNASSWVMIEVRHGDERAHRSTSRSGGTCAPCGRVGDGGGPCRARSLPGVAFRRIDSQGSVRASRLR